jgi:hypothetical protein
MFLDGPRKWDARCTRQGLDRGFVTWKLPVSQTGDSLQDFSLPPGQNTDLDTMRMETWGLAKTESVEPFPLIFIG